jgi:hypothetical protein
MDKKVRQQLIVSLERIARSQPIYKPLQMGYPPVQLYYPAPMPVSYSASDTLLVQSDTIVSMDNRYRPRLLLSHNTAFSDFKKR